MKKPFISKESARIMFDLGIEVLKSMRNIYETKTEERILLKNDNTTEINTGDSKKDSDSSDRVTDP